TLETRHADEGSRTTRSIGGQLLLDTPFGTCIRLGASGVLLRLFGGPIGSGAARGRQERHHQEYLANPSRCNPKPAFHGSPPSAAAEELDASGPIDGRQSAGREGEMTGGTERRPASADGAELPQISKCSRWPAVGQGLRETPAADMCRAAYWG